MSVRRCYRFLCEVAPAFAALTGGIVAIIVSITFLAALVTP